MFTGCNLYFNLTHNTQNKRDYYKQYYEKRKEQILERAKIRDKENYCKRAIRDISNRKDIKDFKPEIIEKGK